MKCRVIVETYDHELITALKQLKRKKGKYIRVAIETFFHTKKGRKTLDHILNEKPDLSVKIEKKGRTDKKKETVFNIDDFLS
jgi:uncharacterized Fe-S cluster-containing radical SAM superfamily protein